MAAGDDYGVGTGGVALESNPAFERGGVPVTMDNVVRAETAKYFCEETSKTGPNRFRHEREGIQLDAQTVIRSNFDQIYSYGVFDAEWSLTVYNVDGWVVTDRFNINSHQAVPNTDGTYTLTFNGGDHAVNPLDVPENWNGLFRCYLPSSVDGIVAFQQDLVTNHPILPLA